MIEHGTIPWFNFNTSPVIIRDISEQQEQAAPWGKASWVLSVKQGGQQCPHQQGPSPTVPKPDEQSRFGCNTQSEESLKHQAKLNWRRRSQVKLRNHQQVWIRSSDTSKLSATAVIPGRSRVRWLLKVLKCKPGSQVSRSGSGSAAYITSHRHGSTVAQSAAKDKGLSSNFSAKEWEATPFHSSLSWGYAAVPYQHSSMGDQIQGRKSVPRTWENHK